MRYTIKNTFTNDEISRIENSINEFEEYSNSGIYSFILFRRKADFMLQELEALKEKLHNRECLFSKQEKSALIKIKCKKRFLIKKFRNDAIFNCCYMLVFAFCIIYFLVLRL